MLPPAARRLVLRRLFAEQAQRCAQGGSPFYQALLGAAASDVGAGGPCWSPLRRTDLVTALPLRLMGGVHRLVLEGQAPGLEAHYPSVGGDGDAVAAWPAFVQAIDQHAEYLAAFVQGPVQTNEVGRCRALLGGFLAIAELTGRPLRLLEIGASAGLNLRWDRYFYEARGAAWGDPESKVVLRDGFLTEPPFRAVQPVVVERQGCDLYPVDVTARDGANTLLSYTWADQTERIAALRGAIAIAAEIPVALAEADACDWLPTRLETRDGDVATVVFHSYVMQLLDRESRSRLTALMERAGRAATRTRPLAWLQYEYLGGKGTVRLRTWPQPLDTVLARASAHGQNIEWVPAPIPTA